MSTGCAVCGSGFRDGQRVVPVLTYVTNEKRGDFVTTQPVAYIHAHHVGVSQ